MANVFKVTEGIYIGKAADAKPTDVSEGAIFIESDGGFYFRRANAWNTLTVFRAGKIGIGKDPTWVLDIGTNANSVQESRITNSSAGAGAFALYVSANDAGSLTQIGIASSTNTYLSDVAGGSFLEGNSTGGLGLGATNAAGTLRFYSNGTTERGRFTLGLQVGSPTGGDKGVGTINAVKLYSAEAAFVIHGTVAWSNGAGAATGTLTNAPAATNPTKWIPVDDAGVTRYVPAW